MSMLTKIVKRLRNAIPSIVFRFVLPSFISLLLEDGIVYFMKVKMMIFWYYLKTREKFQKKRQVIHYRQGCFSKINLTHLWSR